MAKFYQLELNDVKWLGCDRFQKFVIGVSRVKKERKFGSRKMYYFEVMKFNFYIKRINVFAKFYLPHNVHQLAHSSTFTWNTETSTMIVAPWRIRLENVGVNTPAKFVISKFYLETGVYNYYFVNCQLPPLNEIEPKQIASKINVIFTPKFGWGCIADGGKHVRFYSFSFNDFRNEVVQKFESQLPDKFSSARIATLGNYLYCLTKYDMVLSVFNVEEKILTNIKMESSGDFNSLSVTGWVFFEFNNYVCSVKERVTENESELQVHKLNSTKSKWELTKYDLPLPTLSANVEWKVDVVGSANMFLVTLQSSTASNSFIIIQPLRFPSLLDTIFEKYCLYCNGNSEMAFIDGVNFPPMLIRECFGPMWTINGKDDKDENKKRKPLRNIFLCCY